jgi:hypothetical protein
MARPKLIKEDGDVITMDEYPRVKQLMDVISKRDQDNDAEGYHRIGTIDAKVGAWVEKGYRLVSTHFISENPEGFQMLYILEKI